MLLISNIDKSISNFQIGKLNNEFGHIFGTFGKLIFLKSFTVPS